MLKFDKIILSKYGLSVEKGYVMACLNYLLMKIKLKHLLIPLRYLPLYGMII